MKVGERFVPVPGSDTAFAVHRYYDIDPLLKEAHALRDLGLGQKGHNKLVARVPMWKIAEWIKEAGLDWSDTEAVEDLLTKKLMSGEVDKLRIWRGTF